MHPRYTGIADRKKATKITKTVKYDYEHKGKTVKSKIPPEGQDLISKLMAWNPEERITLEEAKTHPYFGDLDWSKCKDGKLQVPFVPKLGVNAKSIMALYNSANADETIIKETELLPEELNQIPNFQFISKKLHRKDIRNHVTKILDGGYDDLPAYSKKVGGAKSKGCICC